MQEFMINYSINFNEPVKNGDKWEGGKKKEEGGRRKEEVKSGRC